MGWVWVFVFNIKKVFSIYITRVNKLQDVQKSKGTARKSENGKMR